MFAQRIWGSDFSKPSAQVALSAGWRRVDILWEELLVKGNIAWSDGASRRAARCFRRASIVAQICFRRSDLRRATALVNLGILQQHAGRTARARACFSRALAHWDANAERTIADMQIAPRARSSLFHLRMEALHRETYHDNLRVRLRNIASEVRMAIRNLDADRPPGCRLYSRWNGERPTVFDDTRKVVGACLLIIDSQSTPDDERSKSPLL